MDFSQYQKGTAAVWGGEGDVNAKGALTAPIVNSVAFSYPDLDEWHDVSTGKAPGFI